MPLSIEFQAITASDPDFDAAMAIYLASFPAVERHPVERIRARVAAGRSLLHVGHSDGRVVFMALLWPIEATMFTLLDYLATHTDFRGRGIASQFMVRMRAQMDSASTYLVMEVEDPAHGDNRRERQQRYDLYRHLGARQLQGIHYLLPPLQGGEPTDMILMLFPEGRDGYLRGDIVKLLITKIYAELYGRTDDDPLLSRSLQNIQSEVQLI